MVAGLDLTILIIDIRNGLDLLGGELHIKIDKRWLVWIACREDNLDREGPSLSLERSFEHEEISCRLSRECYKSYVRFSADLLNLSQNMRIVVNVCRKIWHC